MHNRRVKIFGKPEQIRRLPNLAMSSTSDPDLASRIAKRIDENLGRTQNAAVVPQMFAD